MSKCCGNCARSCTNNVDGTICSKSGKPVSFLAVYDCWTDQAEPDPAPLTKVCQRCGCELPIDHFGRHARTKDGYQPLCRECLREANTGKRKRQPWKTADQVEAEKTVPKVVIEKGPSIGEKVQPITPLEKFETAEIVEELRRRGFRCIIWMEV